MDNDFMKLRDELAGLASKASEGPLQIVPYGDGDSLVLHKLNTETRVCFMPTPANDGYMGEIRANAKLIREVFNNLPTILSSLSMAADAGIPSADRPTSWFNEEPEMCHRTTSLAAQDGLVEALEKVRKCALVVPSIFPDRPPSVSWIVSELTKVLPEMDAALTAIKGDKS